ncbi:MAG TPA: hypothetical protein QGG47_00085 [Acidobacteriota bacterium]|nr:hypothetical protein [Acidobacteriota bacterium]
MSKRRLTRLAGVVLLVGTLAFAAGCASHYGRYGVSYGRPAPGWHYGSSFHVGGLGFQVLYSNLGPRRGHYFRSARFGPSRYCNRYCYRDRGHSYHHSGCGHFGRYVSGYGYNVGSLIRHYGPRY